MRVSGGFVLVAICASACGGKEQGTTHAAPSATAPAATASPSVIPSPTEPGWTIPGATTLASLTAVPGGGIAVDATNVYFTTGCESSTDGMACSGSALMKVPLGGGPVVRLAGGSGALGLALDGKDAYWTDTLGWLDVRKVPIGGGAPTVFAGPAFGFVIDGSTLYFTSSRCAVPPRSGPCAGSVMSVSVLGGSPTQIATLPPGPTAPASGGPNAVAVDAENVYWTGHGCGDAGCDGATVNRVGHFGGPVTTLASNPSSSGVGAGVAVDSTGVYWLDFACSRSGPSLCVMKIPK